MFGEEGNAKFDPADDSDSPEESVEEMNDPSTLRCRGCGFGEKGDVVVVVVVIGGEDNKHRVLLENKCPCGNYIYMLLVLV